MGHRRGDTSSAADVNGCQVAASVDAGHGASRSCAAGHACPRPSTPGTTDAAIGALPADRDTRQVAERPQPPRCSSGPCDPRATAGGATGFATGSGGQVLAHELAPHAYPPRFPKLTVKGAARHSYLPIAQEEGARPYAVATRRRRDLTPTRPKARNSQTQGLFWQHELGTQCGPTLEITRPVEFY